MSTGLMSERARRAYQTTQLQMEDPMGLVVRLYDGMLMFMRRGADALREGKRGEASKPIRRATDIVGELQAVLNVAEGGEVARNLDRLYTYARRRIMEAHMAGDPAGLDEVVRVLTPLRDAWAEARLKQMQQVEAAP